MARLTQRHRAVRLIAALALGALSMPLLQSPARADLVGGFEVDGNQVTQGAVDWQTISDVDVVADPVGNADASVFDGGDSETDNDGIGNQSPWGIGSAGTPSGKSDIGNILVTDFKVNGETHAAFAWDRAGDVGTGRYYLELNQKPPSGVMPARTNGDVRIIVAINGSALLQCVSVQKWSGQWGAAMPCGPSSFKIVVNDATITDYFGSGNAPLEQNTFIEGVLNLSAFGLTTCPVAGFESIHLRSQEGGENGDTSRLKDFGTGPISIDSDCGSLTIVKNVVGGDGSGAGAVFQVDPNPTAGQPGQPPLIVTTGADGTVTVPAAKPGTYAVRELVPPSGYLLPADDTKQVTVPPGDPGVVQFDDVLGDVRFSKSYEGTDPSGTGATFTVTRDQRWVYDGDPAGGFAAPGLTGVAPESLDVTDNGPGDSDGDIGELHVVGLKGGSYTIAEKTAPAGWQPAPGNLTAGFVVGPTDAAAQRSKNLDASNGSATFHNVLRPIAVKVVKTESVPGVPQDTKRLSGVTFNLYRADGVPGFGDGDTLVSSQVTGASGEIVWTGLDWQIDYWLQEVKKPGYEIGLVPNPRLVDIDQANPPTSNDTVVTVDVDNPREEVSIRLRKTDGTSGSLLDGGQFDLYREANGTPGLQPASDVKVNAAPHALVNGELTFSRADYQTPWGYTYYVLEVTAPDGYDLMTPNPIAVTPGEEDADTTVTLNATDPRLPVTLTLVKIVDNSGTSGTATIADFPLSADGPTDLADVISGTPQATDVPVDPGTYVLSETNPNAVQGYSASSWSCVGNGDTGSDGQVTLALGDDVTCTITNTAAAGMYTVSKSSDPPSGSTVLRGQLVTYTITVTKTAGVDPTDVLVADDLSGVLNHADLEGPVTASSGTAVLDGDALEWTIPVLSGTETLTYSIRVEDQDDDNGVTLRNHVTSDGSSTCPTAPRVEADDCTTEHHTPHYVLEKTSNPPSGSTVDAGTDVVYTLEVTNDSDAVLSGAVVTDDLSDVVDDTSAPTGLGAGASYDSEGRVLTWTVPTLQPGQSASVSYTVHIDEDAWGVTIGNVATPDEVGDCEASCATQHQTPHWALTKTSDPEPGSAVAPGDQVEFTLTAHNDSDGQVTGVTVTDDLSEVLDDATVKLPLPAGLELDGAELTWTVPALAPGESASVSYTVVVDEDAWGVTLRNVATPDQTSGECVESCSTEHVTPHWTLTKSSTPPSGSVVEAGTDVTYTLTAHNDSATDLVGASVTDDLSGVLNHGSIDEDSLPDGMMLNDDDPSNPFLTWAVPTLAPGTTDSVSYTVHIDDDAWGVTVRNHATPDQPSGECVGENRCSTEHLTGSYELSKTSIPTSGTEVEPGDEVTYRLTVHNDSEAVVESATVVDDLSDVLDDATLQLPLAAGLTLDGDVLTWHVPAPLAPDATVWVEYTVTIGDHAWGVTLRNVATPVDDHGRCVTVDGCETTHSTPPVTTLVVKKVDLEQLEDKPLAGATFALWQDHPPLSSPAEPGSPATVGDEDTLLGSTVTGPDGLARFAELRPGHYLLRETVPPPGYDVPVVDTITIEITEGPDGNFVPGGEMAEILFRDPAQGQLTLLAKRQYERLGGEWVESDGVVRHGDLVRYVLDVRATGPRLFHDVTVSDYVPGYNPADHTSTRKGALVPGTAACVGVECTVTVGDDGLVTWRAGTLTDKEFSVEMVAGFPDLPQPVPFDSNNTFRTVLWNVGYLDWDEVATDRVLPVPGVPLRTAHRRLTSNDVVVRAEVTTQVLPEEESRPNPGQSPGQTPGPAVLPDTGASQQAQALGLLGALALTLGGSLLLLAHRRREA